MKKLIRSLAVTFVAFEAADAFFTLWAVNHGFQEANPLLAPIAGTWISPVVKILPAALVAFFLARLGDRFPKTRPVTAFGLFAVVGFLGVVLAANTVEL